MVKHCKIFWNKIKKGKPYLIRFDKNTIMKNKIYPTANYDYS